jgi:hypothetical protein
VGQSFSNACFLPLASEFLTDGKSEIVNIPITEAEVINTINTLKNKTSCGYDGVSKLLNYVIRLLNHLHIYIICKFSHLS